MSLCQKKSRSGGVWQCVKESGDVVIVKTAEQLRGLVSLKYLQQLLSVKSCLAANMTAYACAHIHCGVDRWSSADNQQNRLRAVEYY